MTREPEALAWVMHTAVGEERALPDGDAWRHAIAGLGSSRLLALAGHLLGERKALLPSDVRMAFEAAALEADVIAQRNRSQLAEIVDRFVGREPGWVVLKGWPLAARLYPAPCCRPSGDLDLLVGPAARRPVIQGLLTLGYERHPDSDDFHHRYLRRRSDGGRDVIELHHSPGPREFGGPDVNEILSTRSIFQSDIGPVWIPSPPVERDLLLRHYLRHGGNQAILLLDLLLHLDGDRYHHQLGALISSDLVRLGFDPIIDGPRTLRHQVLARWMRTRTFEERRAARHVSVAGLPLALARSKRAAFRALTRVVWPRYPTARWRASSRSSAGRWTWRLHRLARMGRD
jgi:hypothetical protein